MVPIQVTSAPQIRAYPKLNPNREQQKQIQGPAVTVFVGMLLPCLLFFNLVFIWP